MMRSRHSDYIRLMFANVGFPKKRVGILDAPLAGRLKRFDVEVQMCPATAASFLAKNPELLAGFDFFARLNRFVDGLKMRVSVEPAMVIQYINVIVVSVRLVKRRIGVSLDCFPAGRNHQTIASGTDID